MLRPAKFTCQSRPSPNGFLQVGQQVQLRIQGVRVPVVLNVHQPKSGDDMHCVCGLAASAGSEYDERGGWGLAMAWPIVEPALIMLALYA